MVQLNFSNSFYIRNKFTHHAIQLFLKINIFFLLGISFMFVSYISSYFNKNLSLSKEDDFYVFTKILSFLVFITLRYMFLPFSQTNSRGKEIILHFLVTLVRQKKPTTFSFLRSFLVHSFPLSPLYCISSAEPLTANRACAALTIPHKMPDNI